MKVNNAFYPACEKHVKAEVKLMSWSPKFDLLVVATVTGELLLYRLVSKEKIWGLPVPDAGVGILSVCWRPDGKLIAVSYDIARHGLHFIALEKPTKVGQFSLKEETATLLKWTNIECPNLAAMSNYGEELSSKDYLPRIPVWEFESKERAKNFGYLEQGKFSILLICDSSCHVTLLANGIFPIVKISCSDRDVSKQHLIAVHLTSKMQSLSVVRISNISNVESLQLRMYNLENMSKNMKLYEAAAYKGYQILSLEAYLSEILDNVSEQCDVVTQEMDSHLVSYLNKSASSDRIGDDLLQLLMWGKATQALTDIFTNHMTKRGIKKLGTLIESSYTSIQQDLTLNFQNGLMNLYYHLTEMKGMVEDGKHTLPFCIKDIDELISTAGSLLLKTAELLHVIDSSLKNFKAFFRWLYISMLKMQDEPVDKIGNVSMSETAFVADFIHEHLTFRSQDERKSRQFQLEKVFQYLKDEPLTSRMKTSQNEWLNFVSSSNILSSCKMMVQPYPELSLRQIFKILSDQLGETIRLPKFSKNQDVDLLKSIELSSVQRNDSPKAQFWTKVPQEDAKNGEDIANQGTYLLATENDGPWKDATLYFLGTNSSSLEDVKALRMHISHSGEESSGAAQSADSKTVNICDFTSYNENTITCLLQEGPDEKCTNYLAQVDLTLAFQQLHSDGVSPKTWPFKMASYDRLGIPSIDVSDSCIDVRELGRKASFDSVAASASRKVSCVLSSDHHNIRPFLLDGTEEEDESVLETEDGE